METTKIPLASCVESSYQNRKELGDVTGLARSIEVNGQITPLIVVADGEAYQLVAGHRRTAAMKSLGLEEADAYVMDGWDDARIAQVLNAENNHRRELTEAERGRGIQTMLSLGVPVADAAVSADIPEERAESYVRGTKVVPVDAVNLDFDAVALMGDYDDVLTEDDVVAVLSKKSHWDRVSATAKSAERATLSRRRRPRFPAGGATALWPPALPRAAAQGALDRGVVEVRGPDLNLQRRGALGVPGRDRPARDLPSAELREPDRHRDVLCAERGQPPRGVRGPHDCPLSGSPSPSAASASRSFMR